MLIVSGVEQVEPKELPDRISGFEHVAGIACQGKAFA